VIINTRWNVVAKGGLVLPILSLYTQQNAFTQSKNIANVVVLLCDVGVARLYCIINFVVCHCLMKLLSMTFQCLSNP
jgi:hypothetical protein